ncbi:unnamed protein product [Paramecium sonneborni]|uniref:Uncharacterized protein n=1 Tax=Paramecium sonneborni TaxID=65129 RepID=A0A8S1PFW7_9CILI|nr:unnamed protein product [Paramecium sonneborni]
MPFLFRWQRVIQRQTCFIQRNFRIYFWILLFRIYIFKNFIEKIKQNEEVKSLKSQ